MQNIEWLWTTHTAQYFSVDSTIGMNELYRATKYRWVHKNFKNFQKNIERPTQYWILFWAIFLRTLSIFLHKHKIFKVFTTVKVSLHSFERFILLSVLGLKKYVFQINMQSSAPGVESNPSINVSIIRMMLNLKKRNFHFLVIYIFCAG